MIGKKQYNKIPGVLSEGEFDRFVVPYLKKGTRGPNKKLSFFKLFNYILKLMHTGCQWEQIPIDKDEKGKPEIHYTNIFNAFKFWVQQECFDKIFEGSVSKLFKLGMLDTSALHGDGTSTAAKKRGDNLGYNGYKHLKGDKVVVLCDRNCNIIAPFVVAPGNRNETILLIPEMKKLVNIANTLGIKLLGGIISLDGVYNSRKNRKAIFNLGMTPNIPENKGDRKKTKRGRKQIYSTDIFAELFNAIERIFAWEDKFKRLLLRFEFHSINHYAMKTIAYTMINLRHFCG